jgi:DNA-binding transcriptional LysR family regulator
LPKKHLLVQKDKVPASDLDGERLLLFSKADYPEYWAAVTSFFKAHGVNAKVAGEFDGATRLLTALEGGMGVALVAAADRIGESELLVLREIDPSPPAVCVAAGTRAGGERSALTEVFIEELKDASLAG